MSYYLKRFGLVYDTATVLPVMNADQDMGPDPVLPTNIVLPGGGTFDVRGTDQALPSGHVLTARGIYETADGAALQILTDAIRAWVGRKTKLWLYCADTSVRWRYARLLAAPMKAVPEDYGRFWQPMDLTFELDDMLWCGADGTDTIILATVVEQEEIDNAGNQVVRDIKITVTAKTSAITQFDIKNVETGHISYVRFSGTIAIDTDLVIDLGEMSVKNDGIDAWDDLDRISGHTINELLRLASGYNTIIVARTGGGATSTCKFEFYDGYS